MRCFAARGSPARSGVNLVCFGRVSFDGLHTCSKPARTFVLLSTPGTEGGLAFAAILPGAGWEPITPVRIVCDSRNPSLKDISRLGNQEQVAGHLLPWLRGHRGKRSSSLVLMCCTKPGSCQALPLRVPSHLRAPGSSRIKKEIRNIGLTYAALWERFRSCLPSL